MSHTQINYNCKLQNKYDSVTVTLLKGEDNCHHVELLLFLAQNYETISNPCTAKETCSECITSNPQCGWCMKRGNFSYPRCDFVYRLADHGCGDQYYFPSPSYNPIINENHLSSAGPDGDTIQMKPQRIHLQIRPNLPYSIFVHFRQALDYPVDLYYLMDLSKSMEDDKAKLAELGNLLASKMRTITSDFRLGFGSFVDKVVMPYVSTVPEK